MNQDFPLSTQTQSGSDFWTGNTALAQPTPAAPGRTGGTQSTKPSPMQKIHRLLRGRYPLAIVLAVLFAVIGGVGGYMALPPRWESPGFVEISPWNFTPGATVDTMPLLATFISTQCSVIQGSDVAEKATQDPDFVDAWSRAYGSTPVPSIADFQAALDAQHLRAGFLVRVAFTDKNKQVAEAGCRAALKAYMALHGSVDDDANIEERINFNRDKQKKDLANLEYKKRDLNTLSEKYGSIDLDEANKTMQNQLIVTRNQVTALKQAYEDAQKALENRTPDAAPPDKETVYLQIAAYPDQRMSNLLQIRDASQKRLSEMAARLGKNHPSLQGEEMECKLDQDALDKYARDFRITHPNFIGPSLSDGLTADGVDRLKRQYESLKQIENNQKIEAHDLGYQINLINDAKEQIHALNNSIDTAQQRIEQLEATRTLTKRITLVDPGREAQLPTDKRKVAAGVGAVFGGLLPLGLMLLYGLTENKYRFSSDADEHSMLGTTLLGILPNLPDRLSDPQQAGVAAHCVHQIRTMLQISRSNDEPQVLAITSASSGDGKTSLCLALGLSYAACGARTLLVDCDLVAAGLTHRLNVTSTDGVLEAVANRALLEYVRTTDIADVAILPVGTTHAHHASTLSPVALRRLISEGKKHFDIIIIDTGPLLGSIEASLVCAAADRSILAVARNQQRPLVERSIRHLAEIGANLAGVVFNRAHASDFERSMSGLALRSRPAGPVAPGQTSAVAGSFKKRAG